MKRKDIKSLILGKKKNKHIESVYYKNIFNVLSIVLLKNHKLIKYLYDKEF